MRYLTFIALISITSVAGAQVPQVVETGVRVEPLRIAEIGADYRIIGDWVDYEPFGYGLFYIEFDALGIDSHRDLVGGLACGLPTESSRWYLGSDYCNPFVTNDTDNQYGESNCFETEVAYAWYWTAGGVGTQEHCYVVFQLNDKFSPDCDGPDSEVPLSGFVADFGPLDGDTGDYFYAVIESFIVTNGNGGLGVDAYELIFAQDYDPASGQITLATCAQPMLWGTQDPWDGFHGPLQWNDVAPTDGVHTAPDECFDMSFGLCPEPLGAAVALASGGEGCDPYGQCVDLSSTTLVGGSPATFFGRTVLPNVLVQVHYALDSTAVGEPVRFGDICGESELVPPEGLGVVWMGTSDDRNDYEFSVYVPLRARGRTIYFQAFAAFRCPDVQCDSDLVIRTVL